MTPERQRIEIDADDDTVGATWDENAAYDIEIDGEEDED